MEKVTDVAGRIAKEKEDLTKEKAELVVQLTAAERENRAQSEVFRGISSFCLNKSNLTGRMFL